MMLPRKPAENEKGIIWDIGAHKGSDTAYYLLEGYSVVAVEAGPELAAGLEDNFGACEQVAIVKAALMGKPKSKTVKLYVRPGHDDWGSMVRKQPKWINVPTVSIKELLDAYGTPHYCKMDIEGAESEILHSWQEQGLPVPNYISVEMSDPHVWKVLLAMGYRLFKLVDQNDKQKWRKCPFGSWTDSYSGPFGEEAAGQWQAEEQMLERLKILLKTPDTFWCDIHARLP